MGCAVLPHEHQFLLPPNPTVKVPHGVAHVGSQVGGVLFWEQVSHAALGRAVQGQQGVCRSRGIQSCSLQTVVTDTCLLGPPDSHPASGARSPGCERKLLDPPPLGLGSGLPFSSNQGQIWGIFETSKAYGRAGLGLALCFCSAELREPCQIPATMPGWGCGQSCGADSNCLAWESKPTAPR